MASKSKSEITTSNVSNSSSTRNQCSASSKAVSASETITTTKTYYDSKGHVIKTVTDVDSHVIPGFSEKIAITDQSGFPESDGTKLRAIGDSSVCEIETEGSQNNKYHVEENYHDFSKQRAAETITDSRDFYGHRVDSKNTLVKNVYDTSAIQNTIGTRGHIMKDDTMDRTDIVYSNDRNYGKTGWNGHFTYETPQKAKEQAHTHAQKRTDSPTTSPVHASQHSGEHSSRQSLKPSMVNSTEECSALNTPSDQQTFTNNSENDTVHYVDENYVDTNKIHQKQMSSSSGNFYGHRVDPRSTMVNNVYDTKAIQNTIGTKGRVLRDNVTDEPDVIYSYDRNYGKTGWNGKFVYEQPQKLKK